MADKERIRQAADLVEIVQGRVRLARRSGRWWGRCPFHDEKTPSFSLLPPEFERYYCHGCGASGDVFNWMMLQEGSGTFREALETLAERYGVELDEHELSPDEKRRLGERKRHQDLLERATTYFVKLLWTSAQAEGARTYLAERGFSEELLRRFRLGWAPGRGSTLVSAALAEGFSREDLMATGLARSRGRSLEDFFTKRIIFPISDPRGQVQGFGARTLDPAEQAKYVNSPEREGFRKRQLIFGIAEARARASKERWCVVTEGYTDVLAFAAAGVENAVACMGTALTSEQLRLLQRWTPEVRLCFDADSAGERAAWRTMEASAGLQLRLTAVRLPPGRDPGDLAATAEGRESLSRATTAPEVLLGSLISSRVDRAKSSQERDAAKDDIVGLLRGLPESVEKDEGVRLAAGLLRLSRGAEEHLHEEARRRGASTPAAAPEPSSETSPQEARERRFLALSVAMPDAARAYLDGMSSAALEGAPHRRALELLRAGACLDDWPPELAPLVALLRVEAADAGPDGAGAAQLREAAYRLELAAVERRAAELRERGDAEGRLAALALARKLRAALRTES